LAKKRKRRRRPRRPADEAAAKQSPSPQVAERPARRPSQSHRSADDRPAAPWGSFPLVELVVLIGIVLLVVGFIVAGSRGTVMIATGLALGSLAGLELAIREHFAGYRSHTLLLAGAAAIACLAALYFLAPSSLSPGLRLGVAAAVFGLAAWGLTGAFRRRSGGLAFRIRGFRG
jgi:hypothetical protein